MEAAEVCVTLTKLRPVALTTTYFDRSEIATPATTVTLSQRGRS